MIDHEALIVHWLLRILKEGGAGQSSGVAPKEHLKLNRDLFFHAGEYLMKISLRTPPVDIIAVETTQMDSTTHSSTEILRYIFGCGIDNSPKYLLGLADITFGYMKWLENVYEGYIFLVQVFMSVWRAFIKEGKEQEEALVLALNHLRFVEEHIKGKRFFGGDEISFTDFIFSCLILEEVIEVQILDPQTFPSLLAWIEVFSEVPVVKENWPPREKMIVKFKAIREYYLASN
uniref:GST C-terminal domain-containing protein n=1 Tax=Kalanchoe fedtschenkoi TaxID=63787 RepID=A0A7N0VJ80_KALFE